MKKTTHRILRYALLSAAMLCLCAVVFGQTAAAEKATVPLTTLEAQGSEEAELLASTYTWGNLRYSFNGDGGITITGCVSNTTSAEIPSEINQVPVTEIGPAAFKGKINLKSVSIPDSVTCIGDNAFENCSDLTTFNLGKKLQSIGNEAFRECRSLTGDLILPDYVTSIGESAFYDCYGLTGDLIIPEGVTRIRSGAFEKCAGLTSLSLGQGVQIIENSAFDGCKGLTGNLDLPDGVTRIGSRAFRYCSGITGDLTIPEGVTEVENEAFESCSGFSSLNLGKNIHSIGDGAFGSCKGLTGNLILPEGVTEIGDLAFCSCKGLTGDLILPDGVIRIGYGAFTGCTSLDGILRLPDTLETIGNVAFRYCAGLHGDLVLPPHLETIGDYAFAQCEGLTGSLSFGDSLTYLGQSAFENCTGLRGPSLTFPATLTKIGQGAFANSGYAIYGTDLYLPGSMTSIQTGAFRYQRVDRVRTIYYYGKLPSLPPGLSYDAIVSCGDTAPASVAITGSTSVIQMKTTTRLRATVFPASASNRVVTWSSSDAAVAAVSSSGVVTGVSAGSAVITATTVNGCTAQWPITVRDDVAIIRVYGVDLEQKNMTLSQILSLPDIDPLPLPGAVVTIGAIQRSTDETGTAVFHKYEFPSYSVTGDITVDAGSEYFPQTGEVKDGIVYAPYVKLGESFSNAFYLESKGDDIYISEAKACIGGATLDVLNGKKDALVPAIKTDGTPNTVSYFLSVKTDWNKYPKGTITLTGLTSGNTITLKEGVNWVAFGSLFQPKESLKLRIETKNKQGDTVSEETILKLKVYIKPNLEVPPTEELNVGGETEAGGIYFLDKLNVKVKLGDLAKVASQFEYQDGVLTLVFKGEDSEKLSTDLFGGMMSMETQKPEVKITGRIQIPITDVKGGEWSGSLGVSIGANSSSKDFQSFEKKTATDNTAGKLLSAGTTSILNHEFKFLLGEIPMYMDVNLSAGMSGLLALHGPYNKVYFMGKIQFDGSGYIEGGVGGEFTDDLAVKAGVRGTLAVEIPVSFDEADLEQPAFDPSITGTVSGEAKLKVFFLDLGASIKLGSLKWDKDGVEWSSDLVSLQEIGEADWDTFDRTYLENGGGLMTGQQASLLSGAEYGERSPQIFYKNIVPCADAALTQLGNGTPCLLVTMDDRSRNERDMLRLAYSLRDEETGAWSEPVWIGTDATLDTSPCANGSFVVWEDTDRLLSGSDTLTDALNATGISAGVWNGNGYTVTRLTSADSVYDFCPRVAASGESAFAAWLSNHQGSYTGQGVTDLYCAQYNPDEAAWRVQLLAKDIGAVTNLQVRFDGTTGTVLYKTGTTLTALTADAGSSVMEEIGHYGAAGPILAWFDVDKVLHIMDEDGETVLETAFSGRENPVVISNGSASAVFWLEPDGIYYTVRDAFGWSGRLCLETIRDGMAQSLSAAVLDGKLGVSYFETRDSGTDLKTIFAVPGVDLALVDVSCDEDVYYESGILSYTADIYNNGEAAVTDGALNVYNDSGELVHTQAVSPARGNGVSVSGQFSPGEDGEYTFVLSAEGDYHGANNSRTLSVGKLDAAIDDAWFQGGSLYVLAANKGSTPVSGAVLTVRAGSENGDVVADVPAETMLRGDTSLLSIDLAPPEAGVYFLSLDCPKDEAVENNSYLLAYDTQIPVFDSGTPGMEVYAVGSTLTVILHTEKIALDDDTELVVGVYHGSGQMCRIERIEPALSEAVNGDLTVTATVKDIPEDGYVKVFLIRKSSFQPLYSARTLQKADFGEHT